MSPPPPASGPRPGGRGPSRPGSGPATLPTAIIAGKWRVTRFLGAGSFGHVFAGENMLDPSAPEVALKRALTQSDKPTNQPSVGIDYLAAELAGLRQITAVGGAPDSLPKLFSDELIETPRGLIMVMSCHGPALASVKKALMVARMGGNEWGVSEMTASDKVVPGMGLDIEVVVEIGRQLAETLDWIHKQGLVYCDMKLANIVLRHPNPPFTSPNFPADIVLIDHGLIRPIKPPQPAQQPASASSVGSQPNEPQRNDRIGTPRYASISMHRGHPPTPSSDFESLAYTLFDLTLSHLPWTKVDAKPGPATWQAISRAKSHMTEHEWSILLGERDPNAPSARFANTLISLWDAAHLARPRYAGRFNWDQVFDAEAPRRVALWKGVPAHVLDIVGKELAHAQAVAEREAGFLSPSATQLDSWGMPMVLKEAKVAVVNDPWGAAAGPGDVPPPNAAPSSVSSRGGGGSGWDDTWAAAGSSSHGSAGAGWGAAASTPAPAAADRDDGSDGGWGAAADPGWRSGRGGSSRGTARGGRAASGSDRGRGRGPHALQQEMSTRQDEQGQAQAAYVWEQPASPTWDQPRQAQGRASASAARGDADADGWGDQQQQPSRSSPGGAGRWADQRGVSGDQRGATGDGWDRSGGRGNRQQGGDQRGDGWDRSSGRGGNRQQGGDQRGGDGWDRSSGRGGGSRQQGGRWESTTSQDTRRPGNSSESDARSQRGSSGWSGPSNRPASSGWSGSSNRPAGGGWGGEQGEQEDDGWGQSSGGRNGSGRGGRNAGGNRGWPR